MSGQEYKKTKTQWSDEVRERMLYAMQRIKMSNRHLKSDAAIAERLYINSSRINVWDNGQGHPTLENVVDFCKSFSVSAEWLLLGNGQVFGDSEMLKRVESLEQRTDYIEKFLGVEFKEKKAGGRGVRKG
jgi:hypothetical protein